jgi:hypothetical protein
MYLARLAREGGSSGFADQLLDLQGMNEMLGTARLLDEARGYA